MFTRSLAPLKRHGVRVNVLCPEVLTNCMMGGKLLYYYAFIIHLFIYFSTTY